MFETSEDSERIKYIENKNFNVIISPAYAFFKAITFCPALVEERRGVVSGTILQ